MDISKPGFEPKRKLGRLLRMPLPELVARGRQETFKWVERLGASGLVVRPSPHDEKSLSRFVQHCDDVFFAGPHDTHLAETLARETPRHCEELLKSAEEICRGRFDLLGYRGLNLGEQPDWHFDPVSNRRAPFIHWSRLDPLDHLTVGDSKVIWEMNRHQWLVRLGQAYALTGQERYAAAAIRHLRDWIRANPCGMGINWTSSLEAALRLIAWCWTLLLIREARALTAGVFGEVLESIDKHATHVERYLSYYFSPNTHLTGEALGLFYAGLVFAEHRYAARWKALGAEILTAEIERQVLPDGVYFERSTCYQRYTVDIYLHFLVLAGRAGIDVPANVAERVRSMVDALIALRQPDGSMPSIGDADGGLLLPLGRRAPDDFRPTFSTAAVVFKDPVYAWAAGEPAAETLWLLGSGAVGVFDSIEQAQPASDPCRVFGEGGFTVMRSGWDAAAHSLIFDTGPLGCDVSGGHGHADLLSIQCSAYGTPTLVDAGTGCYTGDPDLRDFFRGTAAHSAVMVDGKSHAQPAGPFSWKSRPTARLLQWRSNESFAIALAEHDGYRSLPDSMTHQRRVIFVKPRYWIVIDDLIASDRHRVEIRFQFAPMSVHIDKDGWVRASRDGKSGLLLRSFTSTPFHVDVRQGRRAPTEGWVSPDYGRLEPAPAVVYTATAQLPIRAATLLWPSDDIQKLPRADVIDSVIEHLA